MNPSTRRLACLCALCGAGLSWFCTGQAAQHDPTDFDAAATDSDAAAAETASARSQIRQWVAISNERLDNMRGGFDIGAGLQVSFGIERAIYINGNLVTTTSFNIPDIGKITGEQAQMVAAALGTVTLVQNGPGNTFQPGPIAPGTLATVIQNTLNNQTIRSLTTINTAINSLSLLKSMNAQSALNSALLNAATIK